MEAVEGAERADHVHSQGDQGVMEAVEGAGAGRADNVHSQGDQASGTPVKADPDAPEDKTMTSPRLETITFPISLRLSKPRDEQQTKRHCEELTQLKRRKKQNISTVVQKLLVKLDCESGKQASTSEEERNDVSATKTEDTSSATQHNGKQRRVTKKPFECAECGKKFARQGHLSEHARTHSGDKPYQCLQCSKCFTRAQHLQDHAWVHAGIKRYTCHLCDNTYAKAYDLKAHIRLHNGEKPYECQYCGRVFGVERDLKAHVRIHTGEKPFQCKECGKRFTQAGVLGRHLLLHNKKPSSHCTDCGKTFPSSQQHQCMPHALPDTVL